MGNEQSVIRLITIARQSKETCLSFAGETLQAEWIPLNAALLELIDLKMINMNLIYLPPPLINIGTIQTLDLSQNKILSISNLENLYNLKSLNLSHNKLEFIPDDFVELKHLQFLDISHNLITSRGLPPLLAKMNINVFIAHSNKLTVMDDVLCDFLLQAKEVDVSSNSWTSSELSLLNSHHAGDQKDILKGWKIREQDGRNSSTGLSGFFKRLSLKSSKDEKAETKPANADIDDKIQDQSDLNTNAEFLLVNSLPERTTEILSVPTRIRSPKKIPLKPSPAQQLGKTGSTNSFSSLADLEKEKASFNENSTAPNIAQNQRKIASEKNFKPTPKPLQPKSPLIEAQDVSPKQSPNKKFENEPLSTTSERSPPVLKTTPIEDSRAKIEQIMMDKLKATEERKEEISKLSVNNTNTVTTLKQNQAKEPDNVTEGNISKELSPTKKKSYSIDALNTLLDEQPKPPLNADLGPAPTIPSISTKPEKGNSLKPPAFAVRQRPASPEKSRPFTLSGGESLGVDFTEIQNIKLKKAEVKNSDDHLQKGNLDKSKENINQIKQELPPKPLNYSKPASSDSTGSKPKEPPLPPKPAQNYHVANHGDSNTSTGANQDVQNELSKVLSSRYSNQAVVHTNVLPPRPTKPADVDKPPKLLAKAEQESPSTIPPWILELEKRKKVSTDGEKTR